METAKTEAVAEKLAGWLTRMRGGDLPLAAREACSRLFLDVAGLCIAARHEPYIRATLSASEAGPCTAIGHSGGFDVFSAALINGTAAHGEDYDDTFEGGPVHSGAVVIPAVLAIAEREKRSGQEALTAEAGGSGRLPGGGVEMRQTAAEIARAQQLRLMAIRSSISRGKMLRRRAGEGGG